MERNRKLKSLGKIHVNERIDAERMQIDLNEPHVPNTGTGKRKYQKGDISVSIMQQRRASQYHEHGIGMPGSGSFVLTKQEMIDRGLLNKDGTRKKKADERPEPSRKNKSYSSKKLRVHDDLKKETEILSKKMQIIHDAQRARIASRFKIRQAERDGKNTDSNENKKHRNDRKYYTYGLYVLEIDSDPYYVYVGQSYLSPEERLEQHKNGVHSARSLRGAVRLVLRPDLYEGLPRYQSRDEALKAERDYATKLKNYGYRVEGGH